MADVKRYAMAGGTFACILAIGFFMQGGAKTPQADGAIAQASMGMQPDAPEKTPAKISDISLAAADDSDMNEPTPVVEEVVEEMAPPAADDMTLASVTLPEEAAPATVPEEFAPISVSEPDPMPVEVSLLVNPEPVSEPGSSPRAAPQTDAQCDIEMTAAPMATALVKVNLSAPCFPNERMTMHHDGMTFTDTTDAEGNFQMAVPALSQTAVFIASFANGDGAVASVSVPELVNFDRAVVQSKFSSNAGLHALEFGADYESDGHIWINATGEIADAAVGKGGFMIMLGNPTVSDAQTAQVYTFPTGFAQRDGDIALSVEIEVTEANCGKDIEAQALQTLSEGKPKIHTLDVSMPDCDAVGDFLVLKNLVNDLKVASATN